MDNRSSLLLLLILTTVTIVAAGGWCPCAEECPEPPKCPKCPSEPKIPKGRGIIADEFEWRAHYVHKGFVHAVFNTFHLEAIVIFGVCPFVAIYWMMQFIHYSSFAFMVFLTCCVFFCFFVRMMKCKVVYNWQHPDCSETAKWVIEDIIMVPVRDVIRLYEYYRT